MYLGINSLAIANVEKGVAVSLMELVTFKNDAVKEGLMDILIKTSRSKVLFPKSLEEFEQILTKVLRPPVPS